MKRFFNAALGIVIILALLASFIYRQDIRDQYIARTHQLQPAAQKVADKLELTSRGMLLFRASQPRVQNAQSFNSSCSGVHKELTIVLGCYTNQNIYVFNVTDERLAGVIEVTAAHELLHAGYERLPDSEKDNLSDLLEGVASDIPKDSRLSKTITQYKRTTSGEHYLNELYAITGTEVKDLDSRLEQHYGRYFKNRQKIVAFAMQYESVFSRLEQQIETYDNQLQRRHAEKESLEQMVSNLQSSLSASQSNLNSLRGQSDVSAYNRAIPEHNRLVSRYNQTIERLRSVINQYNQIVEKRNDLAVTQNNLVEQLDSKHEMIDQ